MTNRRCPCCQMLNPPEHRHEDDVCILCRPGDPPWWRVKEARESVVAGRSPFPSPSGDTMSGS